MLFGSFREAQQQPQQLPRVELNEVSPVAFAVVLEYLYTEKIAAQRLSDPTFLIELLRTADLYLLSGLKQICATFLSPLISTENVFDVFTLGEMFNLPRLEEAAVQYFARHLLEVIELPEFEELIRASAQSIANRHAADSVPLADELFSHLQRQYATLEDVALDSMDEYEFGRWQERRNKEGRLRQLLKRCGIQTRRFQEEDDDDAE